MTVQIYSSLGREARIGCNDIPGDWGYVQSEVETAITKAPKSPIEEIVQFVQYRSVGPKSCNSHPKIVPVCFFEVMGFCHMTNCSGLVHIWVIGHSISCDITKNCHLSISYFIAVLKLNDCFFYGDKMWQKNMKVSWLKSHKLPKCEQDLKPMKDPIFDCTGWLLNYLYCLPSCTELNSLFTVVYLYFPSLLL